MNATSSAVRPATPPAAPSWPPAAQRVTVLLLGVALLLLAVHGWGSLASGTRPTSLERDAVLLNPIDLNRASRAELRQVPGIGPTLADRIDAHRKERGGFASVEELGQVPGIGAGRLAQLRPWVVVSEPPGPDDDTLTTPVTLVSPSSAPRSSSKKTTDLAGPIDLNRASVEELQKLPGIGPKLSQAIVAERERAPFGAVEDLRRVRGIGVKTLEKLRPHLTVTSLPDRSTGGGANDY